MPPSTISVTNNDNRTAVRFRWFNEAKEPPVSLSESQRTDSLPILVLKTPTSYSRAVGKMEQTSEGERFPASQTESQEATPSGPSVVRHAEKRRKSTCRFADRIAQFCVDHYRGCVPLSFRDNQKQTCLAAVVAFVNPRAGDCEVEADNSTLSNNPMVSSDGEAEVGSCSDCSRFYMLGMGVGTKFLARDILDEEIRLDASTTSFSKGYGRRVRDCHAEVLARRAFRRELLLTILQDLDPQNRRDAPPILQRVHQSDRRVCYRLRSGVSLHMYTSSAPCGNATLKKFATMKQERFREDLSSNEWPSQAHEPIVGHSIPLGQFALLVKKERTAVDHPSISTAKSSVGVMSMVATSAPKKNPPKQCPALQSTDWCPPGTSTVWSQHGSLHTCSDKICRWNCLGLQGSLLASLLQQPLYISSLTVGRKLTESICRRAVCCRAAVCKREKKARNCMETDQNREGYQINHPAIMGTAVYMDDGVIEMSPSQKGLDRVEGQDVRFHSTLSWAWWPSIAFDHATKLTDQQPATVAECIDGATGFAIPSDSQWKPETLWTGESVNDAAFVSRISTKALVDLHYQVTALLAPESNSDISGGKPGTLAELREFKRQASPEYEAQKHMLLTKHPLFRQWKRRENEIERQTHSS